MDNNDALKEIFGDKSLINAETGVVDRDSPEFIELLKITPRPVFDELHRLAHLWKEQRKREIRRSKELAELLTEIAFRENRIQELQAQAAALRDALFAAREKALKGERWTDDDKTVFALSTDADTALLKRLQAAEAVCETLEGMHLILGNDCGPLLEAWRKAKGE